jgi:hypothetical protein
MVKQNGTPFWSPRPQKQGLPVKSCYDYDLIVIGSGLAVTANGLGKCVAVIKRNRVGGNCTNSTRNPRALKPLD